MPTAENTYNQEHCTNNIVQPRTVLRLDFYRGISRMLTPLLLLLEKILATIVRLPWSLLSYVRDWLHFRKLANRFPGPPALPLVGNLCNCGLIPNTTTLMKWVLEDVMYRYPAGQIMVGPVRVFILSNVNDVQTFLKNSKNQSKPKGMMDCLSYVLGRGLVTINGDEWSRHHKIINPAFHQNLLKTYVPLFDRKSNVFIECLTKYANGCAFDIKHMTEYLEADIVFETLFGVSLNLQMYPDEELFEVVSKGQKKLSHRIKSPWLYLEAIYNLTPYGCKAKDELMWIRRFMDKLVDQRKEILHKNAGSLLTNGRFEEHINTLDTPNVATINDADGESNTKQFTILIDALIREKGMSISHESVLDELVIMFLAGFDTTAITLQFALYYLAKNPLVQEKALSELRNIFDASGSTEVTPDILQRMQYVEMIVKETLRLHSPVFFYLKEAGVDTPLQSCDLVVPAGATVAISPRTMHMDPKVYPDPQVFDPERFSPENSAGRHPFSFIPFAAGVRACIGRKYAMLALKTTISKVIWNYHIEPDESYKPQFLWGVTMVIKNGMRIKLLKRSTYQG